MKVGDDMEGIQLIFTFLRSSDGAVKVLVFTNGAVMERISEDSTKELIRMCHIMSVEPNIVNSHLLLFIALTRAAHCLHFHLSHFSMLTGPSRARRTEQQRETGG